MPEPKEDFPTVNDGNAVRDGAYEVGYGRPPLATRFQPGRSGNPKGRPKGAKNLATLVAEKLNAKITVREGGRAKSMTKAEVAVTKLVNKLVETGDPKIFVMLAKLQGDTGLAASGQRPEERDEAHEHASNEALITWFLEQNRRREDEA